MPFPYLTRAIAVEPGPSADDSASDAPAAGREASARRVAWFRRVWAVLALALFAATWRLWTPQTAYPQVPLLSLGRAAPWWLDWIGLAGIGVSLVTAVLVGPERRIGKAALGLFAVCVAGMIVLDQHRLQPWAYQFALIAVVLATRGSQRSLLLLRILAVSVYFWSALGKFDYTFLHGVGQQFLATIAGWTGASLETWPQEARLVAAGVFPAGELLVALGLCFRATRPAALLGALAMHGGLIALLGPWGLNHQPGVLLWNVFFLAQAVLLFGPSRRRADEEAAARGASPPEVRRWGAPEVLIALAVTLPALEGWGWWDHWLSWGLYSTRAERVTVLVHRLAAFRLAEPLQSYLRPPRSEEDWRELEIDRWSLESLGAPIYPQARFQLGVAEAVGRRHQLGGFLQAVRLRAADRWTGQRRQEVYPGADAVSAALSKMWFNGHPRPQTRSQQAPRPGAPGPSPSRPGAKH